MPHLPRLHARYFSGGCGGLSLFFLLGSTPGSDFPPPAPLEQGSENGEQPPSCRCLSLSFFFITRAILGLDRRLFLRDCHFVCL